MENPPRFFDLWLRKLEKSWVFLPFTSHLYWFPFTSGNKWHLTCFIASCSCYLTRCSPYSFAISVWKLYYSSGTVLWLYSAWWVLGDLVLNFFTCFGQGEGFPRISYILTFIFSTSLCCPSTMFLHFCRSPVHSISHAHLFLFGKTFVGTHFFSNETSVLFLPPFLFELMNNVWVATRSSSPIRLVYVPCSFPFLFLSVTCSAFRDFCFARLLT